ncbi:MAG: BT4734/BF3469 family protein [Candidatus Heimdallarchaeaceae archaeon]|jgi:hypothetical protein
MIVTKSQTKGNHCSPKELDEVFSEIKNGKFKSETSELRSLTKQINSTTDKEVIEHLGSRKEEVKRGLDAIIFSGEFTERNKKSCKVSTGLMVLDFDHINVEYVKQELKQKEYIHACWTSPSGDGVKALAKLKNPTTDDDKFKQQYYGVYADLIHLGLDTSGKDISRLCYQSYDPNIYVNEDSIGFEAKEIDVMRRPLEMIKNAQDGEKHINLVKASHWAGGLVKEGLISPKDAAKKLFEEISNKNITDPEAARKTITDGLKEGSGKKLPNDLIPKPEIRQETILDKYPALSFISNPMLNKEMQIKYKNGEIETANPLGYKQLDNHFRFKEGKFNIIMGHANVGKSHVMWYLMALSNVIHGWKWLIYSQENGAWTIQKQLIEFFTGRTTEQLTDFEIDMVTEHWIKDNFDIIEMEEDVSYRDLLKLADEAKKMKDYKGFLVDPYNSLIVDYSGEDKRVSSHEYHYKAASEFKRWSKNNGITIFLNCHAVSSGVRKTHQGGDYAGHPSPPMSTEIEGGSKFVNKADDFIVIHRYQKKMGEENITHWHQEKVKEQWSGGKPTASEFPVKLAWEDQGGFLGFYGTFNECPMQEKYYEWKNGLQKEL